MKFLTPLFLFKNLTPLSNQRKVPGTTELWTGPRVLVIGCKRWSEGDGPDDMSTSFVADAPEKQWLRVTKRIIEKMKLKWQSTRKWGHKVLPGCWITCDEDGARILAGGPLFHALLTGLGAATVDDTVCALEARWNYIDVVFKFSSTRHRWTRLPLANFRDRPGHRRCCYV